MPAGGRHGAPAAIAHGGAEVWAAEVLEREEQRGLIRRPRSREGGSAPRCVVDGREVTVFSSNDYLGLSVHPAVQSAAAQAAMEHGVGATGSRHLSGCHRAIATLERDLADFEGAATATLAPTGYAANLATLQALAGPDAVVLSDADNHASIIDACRASRSAVEVFRHLDLEDLEQRLGGIRARPVIVSDTVFSMDGSRADVGGLDRLARQHGAWLVLDEAHATGVVGPGGRGAAADAGIDCVADHLVRVVTFSKALGAGGGAILGSLAVAQLLLQRGRSLIFSTALPHPTIAATTAALAVLTARPDLVEKLRANGALLRRELGDLAIPGGPGVPIVGVLTGTPQRAVEAERALWEAGWLIQAVRPPTVPDGTSRLRLVASALLAESELRGAAAAVRDVLSR